MAWWLTFHLLGMVLWTGGLLAISRMAAYHVMEAREVQARFAWVEGRMYWLVTIPGTVITLVTAAGMMRAGWIPYTEFDWFRGKMILIALLAALHATLHVMLGRLREHPEQQKKALFSAIHGSIGLTLIGILIMAMVRPGN